MNPLAIEVALIAIAVSIGSSLVSKKVTNQKRMKEIKDRVSDFQKRYNEAKKSGDEQKIRELEKEQKEIMALTTELMTGSFKPMLYTFVPIIIIFYLLNGFYGSKGNIVEVPVFGLLNWFWWYFLVAIITGLCFEAVYKIITGRKK